MRTVDEEARRRSIVGREAKGLPVADAGVEQRPQQRGRQQRSRGRPEEDPMSVRLEHANLIVRDIDEMTRFLRTAFPEFRVRGARYKRN